MSDDFAFHAGWHKTFKITFVVNLRIDCCSLVYMCLLCSSCLTRAEPFPEALKRPLLVSQPFALDLYLSLSRLHLITRHVAANETQRGSQRKDLVTTGQNMFEVGPDG